MPRKAKSKSINRAQKWKQWYIQQDSKWYVLVFIMLSSSIWAYRLLFVLFISFHILFIYATDNPTLEDHSNKSSPNELTPIYPKQIPLLEEKIPLPQHLSKLVNKNTILNLNIASYFLNILASPDVSTWSTYGGPCRYIWG